MSNLTDNQRMELLSLSYIRAVAADAGFQVTRPETDNDSIDGTLSSGSGRHAKIDFQAKATTQDLVRQDKIHFPLAVKNYEELSAFTRVPRILIVLIMPRDQDQWLEVDPMELRLRRCAYWHSLEGFPSTPNPSNVTVRIPMSHVFNQDELTRLMGQSDAGEKLC